MQEEIGKSSPKGSRPFSTATRRKQEDTIQSAIPEAKNLGFTNKNSAVENHGHIYDLPELPLPETDRLKTRYDPLVLQVTNLLMRNGKKGVAQRVWSSVFPSLLFSGARDINSSSDADDHGGRTWL